MTVPSQLLRSWKHERIGAHPAAVEEAVRDAFSNAGSVATEDVVALYAQIGGMDIPDSRDWRLWPLQEVVAENKQASPFGAGFADYLISSWTFRARPLTLRVSEVYIDYHDGTTPVPVAPSVARFLELLGTEPLRVVDPRALERHRNERDA